MRRARVPFVLAAVLAAVITRGMVGAQQAESRPTPPALLASDSLAVVCASAVGDRRFCEADTTSGVTILRSIGPSACVLGETWGFDQTGIWVSNGCIAEFAVGAQEDSDGSYTPLDGFRLVDTPQGDVNLKVYIYARYLNQLGLDDTFVDSFGNESAIDRRHDVMFQKVNIQLLGWLLSPRFRYYAYIWTSNTSQGLTAQVVIAGHLSYQFAEQFRLGAGVLGLPGVRSTDGNFPIWLSIDNRLMADEFFRPSYTAGIWAEGKVASTLRYRLMLGNNLSHFGVDASQMDPDLDTWSGTVVWMPTTGEFGKLAGFGDFDDHQRVATRLGVHFTRSDENFQAQAEGDGFENVQIRISDGNVVFEPDLFGPGIRVTDVTYHMASTDAALKYRGFSLEGEYYWRWVDNFEGTGTDELDDLRDHGFQVQTSAMPVRRKLQLYASASKVFGEYGDPWDARAGVNWFPFANQVVTWNLEYLHTDRSPVGGTSLPYVVGGNGGVVYSSFQVNF